MPTCVDQAIVLRLSDYSETSQIVSLFTAEHGLVRLIAKGVRRGTRERFAPGLDLLELGAVTFLPARGEAGLGTLTEWQQRDLFGGLRRDLVRLLSGLYAGEAVAALTEEGDSHPALFAALHELLAELGGPDAATAPLVVRSLVQFQLALVTAVGFLPDLVRCVNCGKVRARGAGAYFSSHAGGLACRNCEPKFAEKRRLSAAMLDAGPREGPPLEWFAALDYHLSHVAGRAFRVSAQLLSALTAAH